MKTLYTTYNNFAKRLAFVLTLLLTIGVTTAWAAEAQWEKVTSALTDWSGEYILVYNNQAYDGSLTSGFDSSGNYQTVSDEDGIITLDDKYSVTIKAVSDGYSVQTAAGYFIGRESSSSNGMDAATTYNSTKHKITITYNTTSKTAKLTGSGGKVLGNNSGRWRFFASTNTYVNITLYKKAASTCSYTVTFNGNGNTGGSMSAQEFNCGESKALTANAFTKTGHTFAGWATTANGSVEYTDKESVNLSITNNDNIPLYAQWTPKQVTITWNANGGIVTPSTSTYIYDGSSVTLPTPTRDGYNFKGWYTSASGGNQITDIGTNNKPASDVTYYAQWTEKPLTHYRTSCSDEPIQLATPKVTLTYDCTTATISWDNVANASAYWYQIKKTSDDDAGTSSINTNHTRDDLEQGTSYTWSVKAIGDGTTYLTSEIATGTFTTGYTITYETNGGSAVENACGTKLPSPLPTTTQDGYNFLGWYTDVDLTNQATAGADITKNTTLYAKWEKAKTATSLTWSADSYTATIASESNVFPTLTIYPEAIKESVTYSSSRPEYATIDAAGNIRLLAAGTTTITASYAGDEDYAAAEDTYTLTVEKSDNCRWEEVTIDDIEYGDEVVIAMEKNGSTYALADNNTAASSAPLATEISINANKTINTDITPISTPLIWNIDYDKEGTKNLVIYSTKNVGKWLYSINDNNGVRIGDNTNKEFKIVEGAGNDAGNFFLYHVAQNRYLGVYYTTPDWRGYNTTNNITGQTLKFYKKVCLPNNVSRVTYSVGAGDTAPEEQEVVNNTSITLPSITTSLTCVNFVGWTDAASGYTYGTDNLYKADDSYTVTENVTLHAVYAAGGGYVLVTDEANLAVGDKVIIVATNFNVAMGADRGSNRGQVEVTKDGNTISNIGESQILTLEAGTKSETFAFNTGSGYLYAASSGSNYLKTQANNSDNGSWKIEIDNAGVATIKAQGSNTRNCLRYNSGSSIFSCYASGQEDVSIYKESITGYTTDPECVMYNVTLCTPTNGTISVDKTIVDPYGSATVTFAPASGYMLHAVTVTSGTAIVGAPSYTTSQICGGTVTISNIQSDIEVCATFVEIPYYKVTFVDVNDGSSTQIVQQEAFGADITAPTTASDGCDGGWTFIGWAPSNSLTGATEEPDGLVAPGGTISGSLITDNSLTYYSVYSNSSDGTPPFSIGKSGTYYFKAIIENSDVYYATGEFTGSDRYNTNSTPNIPFLLTYNSVTGKYTIKNTLSNKYLAPDSYDENALAEQDASYGWDVIQPTLYADKGVNAQAKTGEYLFNYTKSDGKSVRYLYCNGSYFDSWTKDYSKYALYLEPASEMHYYNASSCTELVTMTFDVPADAELTYENGYPEGYYKDSEKKNVSTFPTLTYEGWTFIGWTAGASYTDQIGDENLDDENSSSDSPSATIYKTGGAETYYLGADVTMYPVFTKFADNEPFDMVNGGDYYIYYIADGDVDEDVDEYGATKRIYAGGWGSGGTSDSYGATQSCANATLFTFTKLSNGKWSIYDNTKGKYLCAGATDNNLALNTTTATYGEWTITVHNGNQVNAVSKEGYTLSVQSQDANSGTFKNYATSNFNNNSSYYHRVYVGTCTERVYSSNPSNKPKVTLNGTAAVTSTKDQSIRSAKSLTLSAVKLAANGTITLTSDNADVYFSTDKTANFSKGTKPVASLTINADANGKLALTTVYVHYKPTEESNLGIQTVTITATTGTEGQPDYATATTTATVRNLPTDFVIAAKWGDNWYVLPAEMNSETTAEGLLIEVDNPADPTKAIAAPNTTKYGLKAVHTSDHSADRYADYGEYLVFVENVEEETPVANKTLYNGGTTTNKTSIQVYAQYANYHTHDANLEHAKRYEWTPSTTDLKDYILTSAIVLSGDAAARTISLDKHGVFGTLLQDKSYNGMVRLLPVDEFYTPTELQVVEWKANSVSIMYTGKGTKATTQVGNSESAVQLLSEKKIDHAVYTLTTSDLTATTNQVLTISIKDDADNTIETLKLTIPWIVNGSESSTSRVASEVAQSTDIVVLDGATLTADATKYIYNDVVVYPGGKLVIGASGKLGMYSLTLRLGSSWGAAEYEHKYPEFVLNTTTSQAYSNTSGKINLDYVTTKEQYYTFVAPFDVNTKDIKYPVDIYGSNVAANNRGSFEFQYYDGAARSAGNPGWKVVEEGETGATLTAGQGYTFLGMPKKINGDRQIFGIHRIPMTVAAGTAMNRETTDKTAPLSVHLCDKNNNSGWNLIGNPYMSTIGGLTNDDIQVGKLVHTTDANGNWTGGWHWDTSTETTNQRFLVIPSNDGQSYEAVQASNATLPAFKNFFVQISNEEATALSIPVANRVEKSLAPARYAEEQPEKDVELAIVLEQDEEHTDQMDLLINNIYSANFDRDADFTKMMNATNLNLYGVHPYDNLSFVAMDHYTAEQSVKIGYQVPQAGEYTLRMSEKLYVMFDKIEALYVTDHEMSPEVTTDIISEPYRFTVKNAETNNERFTISLKLKSENQGPTTGWENIDVGKDQSIKFIHQDRLYILRNGIIYDATGQPIHTINK